MRWNLFNFFVGLASSTFCWDSNPPTSALGVLPPCYLGSISYPSAGVNQAYSYQFNSSTTSPWLVGFTFRQDPGFWTFRNPSLTSLIPYSTTQILQNANLETGGNVVVNGNSVSVPTSFQVWYQAGQPPPAAGTWSTGQWYDGAVGTFDGIYQAFNATGGVTYTLSFTVSGTNPSDGNAIQLGVYALPCNDPTAPLWLCVPPASIGFDVATLPASGTPTSSVARSVTSSVSSIRTPSSSVSVSASPSMASTVSPSTSSSMSTTLSLTASRSLTLSPSQAQTSSISSSSTSIPSSTTSGSISYSSSVSQTVSSSVLQTGTPTATSTLTATLTGTGTGTQTGTQTGTLTGTGTQTATLTGTGTASQSANATATGTGTQTLSGTSTLTGTGTGTQTLSGTGTATQTANTTATSTGTQTLTGTGTASQTANTTATSTGTQTLSGTGTLTGTGTGTQTGTGTATQTANTTTTPTSTGTATQTGTGTGTLTGTGTGTSTLTGTGTGTGTGTLTGSGTTTVAPTSNSTVSTSISWTGTMNFSITGTETLTGTKTTSPLLALISYSATPSLFSVTSSPLFVMTPYPTVSTTPTTSANLTAAGLEAAGNTGTILGGVAVGMVGLLGAFMVFMNAPTKTINNFIVGLVNRAPIPDSVKNAIGNDPLGKLKSLRSTLTDPKKVKDVALPVSSSTEPVSTEVVSTEVVSTEQVTVPVVVSKTAPAAESQPEPERVQLPNETDSTSTKPAFSVFSYLPSYFVTETTSDNDQDSKKATIELDAADLAAVQAYLKQKGTDHKVVS